MKKLARLVVTAALAAATPSLAEKSTVDFNESIGPGYQPQAEDERGLWMQMDEAERDLKGSKFIIQDAALNAYVRKVLCQTVGQAECAAIRLYLMRTPYFNASMAPTGMMQVWSGLLLRVRDEAQLAAVLGHEYGHYTRRHSLQSFRDIRKKTDIMAWMSFIPYGGSIVGQLAVGASIFSFNRDMESEADRLSLGYLAQGGYTPQSASLIWSQLRDEQDATAAERKQKSRKDKNGGMFATHPNSADRMIELAKLAAQTPARADAGSGRDAYRDALAAWWPLLIADQIKLNDFGATEFLLAQLASEGWTADLLFARGELYRARGTPEDFVQAATFYQQALAADNPRPEVLRGLGLALMRSGQGAEGQQYLQQYLIASPDASDKAMIQMIAGGQ